MNSEIRTYEVGSGEITLTASDAEELRIMLQRDHVHSVMEAVVHANIDDLKLPGKRCERALADWLTEAFGEYVTIDPETDIHVIETAEDLMFGRAEDLGWCDQERDDHADEHNESACEDPTEECRVEVNGMTIVLQRYGKNDYGTWMTDDPSDSSSGMSIRGTFADILHEVSGIVVEEE